MAPPSRTPQTSVTISSDSEDDSTQLDAFDDDTDLPLPNTGTRGALLEEINIEMTPTGRPEQRRRAPGPSAGGVPASTLGGSTAGTDDPLMKQFASNNATARSWAGAGTGQGMQNIIDSNSPEMEKYKKWTCIYPIYIDAKRAYGTGQRRIARDKSVWWPRSQDILAAVASFRLPALHEPMKSHPRDWENPGRVKVLWKQQDGRLTNPNIPTKKRLFEMIAAYIQGAKPEQAPDMSKLSLQDDAAAIPAPPANNDKSLPPKPHPSTMPSARSVRGKTNIRPEPLAIRPRRRLLPKPPQPLPPLQERYSIYSPLVPTGALLDGWKVGTGDKPGGPDGAAATPAAHTGKGKRKVIRIRG